MAITLSCALAESLEAIQEDGRSMDESLMRFPQHREELRPLLEVALALQAARMENKRPSPMYVLGLKERLIRKTKK